MAPDPSTTTPETDAARIDPTTGTDAPSMASPNGSSSPAKHRSRWWRRALVALAAVAALLLLLGTLLVWLATRPDGLQRALRFADGVGGVNITASGVAGPVAGPFQVRQLVISHRRVTVTIDDLQGELRLGALGYGTVGIRELRANRVRVALHPTTEPARDTGFLPAWLRLAWDRLQVNQLDITGSGQPQSLHDVQSSGSLNRWTLRTAPLSAHWHDWTARGALRVEAGSAIAVQWQGQLQGPVLAAGPPWEVLGTFAGEVPANARTTRWQFTATTRRPAGLAADGRLTLSPDGWQVAGNYRAAGVDLAPWGLAAPGRLQANLAGTIAGTGAGTPTNGASSPDASTGAGTGADTATNAVVLDLAGSIDASALAPLGLGAVQAKFTATGSTAGWQVNRAHLQTREWGALSFTGHWALGEKSATGSETGPKTALVGQWSPPGKGEVALNAEANWPEGELPRWRLRANGQRLEPTQRLFTAAMAQAGSRRLPAFDLALDLAGTGFTLPRGASRWEIRRASLDSNGGHLELKGHLGRQGQLQGELRLADLSRWLPGQAGSLQAKFTGDGASIDRGRFAVTPDAQDLAHPAWPTAVSALSLAGHGEWQGGEVQGELSRLNLAAAGAWQRFGELRLRSPARLEGTRHSVGWKALCMELGTKTTQGRLGTLCSTGQWSAVTPWEVQAQAEGLDLGHWRQAAFGMAVPSGALQAELRGIAAAQLTFGGDGRTATRASAANSFFANLTRGQLDAQLAKAEVHWERDGSEGRLALGNVRASAGLRPNDRPGERSGERPGDRTGDSSGRSLGNSSGNSSGNRSGNSFGAVVLDVRASAEAEPGLRLQLQAALRPGPGQRWEEWPLTGEIAGKLPALDFLPAVFEDLDRVAGEVSAQLALGGTLGTPSYRGQMKLRDGELDVVPVNLQLRQVQATLELAPGDLQLSASARAGTGELRTQGHFTFGRSQPLAGEIQLQGEQLLLADVPEARVVAAPDLRFTLRDGELKVAGTVQIPSARFAPQDLTGVVLPSADERIAGVPRDAGGALRTDTRVQLVLGKDVRLDTLGLTGRLQGTLTAHAPPVGTTTATGELAINGGKFKAYTRELEVEKGRLLFTGGPLADPGLDLRASRQFPGVKAGVLVRGTLRRPLVRFFSDPARTQNEIASLLVVGRSLEGLQGNGGASSALNGAAARDTALQQGGALLAAQVGKYVGLDEVQLERDQNDAAALVLGKYLSPRLYVSYGVGLTAALSALKLRYTLGNRWVIKTEAGSRQSLDLEYTTER